MSGLTLLLLLVLLALPRLAQASSHEAHTFFPHSQHPLTVHVLTGDEPGPTILVQGGIQGDEPSGYLTADILSRAQVRRGRLIVIPRANVPSIHARKRQVNVDMNRRFDQDYDRFYEDRLARVVRFLVSRADALIHLHEGSGFYDPVYVDDLRNPSRYGQSIIIDTYVYDGRIRLGETVTEVLKDLNRTIVPADYQFKLFNTRTFEADTHHKEQRKSLTFFCLQGVGIPALAVEVSKNIRPLGWKVRQQLRATQLLLASFGVECSPPVIPDAAIEDVPATTELPGITVNGQPLADGVPLALTLGAPLSVATSDDAFSLPLAPALALTASDRPGVDLLAQQRLPLTPFKNLTLTADGRTVATCPIDWRASVADTGGEASANPSPLYVCWVNGERTLVAEGGVLAAVWGDTLIIDGVIDGAGGGLENYLDPDTARAANASEEILNVKGFVSNPLRNDGQDTGSEIVLGEDSFLDRYLEHEADGGFSFSVARETKGNPGGGFTVRVAPRRVAALALARLTSPEQATKTAATTTEPGSEDVMLAWRPGATALLPPGEYLLAEPLANGKAERLLATTENGPLAWGSRISLAPGQRIHLTLRHAATFRPLGSMVLAAADS